MTKKEIMLRLGAIATQRCSMCRDGYHLARYDDTTCHEIGTFTDLDNMRPADKANVVREHGAIIYLKKVCESADIRNLIFEINGNRL